MYSSKYTKIYFKSNYLIYFKILNKQNISSINRTLISHHKIVKINMSKTKVIMSCIQQCQETKWWPSYGHKLYSRYAFHAFSSVRVKHVCSLRDEIEIKTLYIFLRLYKQYCVIRYVYNGILY